jgi:hypothetical protein
MPRNNSPASASRVAFTAFLRKMKGPCFWIFAGLTGRQFPDGFTPNLSPHPLR